MNELFKVGLELRTSRDLSELADHVHIDAAARDLDAVIRRLQRMMLAHTEGTDWPSPTAPDSPVSGRVRSRI